MENKFDKLQEERFCAVKRNLEIYLSSLCNEENLQKCIEKLRKNLNNPKYLVATVCKFVEEKLEESINYRYTPTAPPLPASHQKIILVVERLAKENPEIPKLLLEHLEAAIFRLDEINPDIVKLENLVYFWTGLFNFFFDEDRKTVQLFIYKCLYFLDNSAISMILIVIKAFPDAIPTKAELLNSYNKDEDWTKMDNVKLRTTSLDLNKIEPLILTLIYYLTNYKFYNAKDPMRKHELYSFFSRHYNFSPNFITNNKLLKILMLHIQENRSDNVATSLILLGKRADIQYSNENEVQEDCVRGMLRIRSLLEDQTEICRIIKNWDPKYEINSHLKTMLNKKFVEL